MHIQSPISTIRLGFTLVLIAVSNARPLQNVQADISPIEVEAGVQMLPRSQPETRPGAASTGVITSESVKGLKDLGFYKAQ